MQTQARRPRGKAPFGRCPSSRVPEESGGQVPAPTRAPPPARARGRGGRTGGSPPGGLPPRPPARPPRAAGRRSSPTRLPLAPLLSVTSYITTRADQNGSNARGRARPPAGPGARGPRPRGPPREAPRSAASRRGEGPERRTRLVPPRRRRCRGRSPSGSRERHQLRQLLQTHFTVSFQPGSRGGSGGGAAAAAGRKPSGEEKVPRGPPSARPAPGPAAPPAPRAARRPVTGGRLGNL